MTLSSVDSFIFAQRDANGNVIGLVAATSDSGFVLDPRSGGTGTSAADLSFRVSAVGGLTASAGFDVDGVPRIDISGAPVPGLANASALHGSSISAAIANFQDVLTWDGTQWIAQSVAGATNSVDFSAVYLVGTFVGDNLIDASAVGAALYLSAGPNIAFVGDNTSKTISISGPEPGASFGGDATSIQGSSVSTDPAVLGDVLAWDGSQWIHSGVTHPGAAGNSTDYSAVYLAGDTGGDLNVFASGVGAGFTLSAGPNIRLVGNNTTKVIGISGTTPQAPSEDIINYFSAVGSSGTGAEGEYTAQGPDRVNFSGGNNVRIVISGKTIGVSAANAPTSTDATSIQGSSISTDDAITGDVLAWDGSQWIHSGITHPGAVGNSVDYSAVYLAGTTTGDAAVVASGIGAGFTLSAGPNIAFVGNNTTKIISISGVNAGAISNSDDFSGIGKIGNVLADSDPNIVAGQVGDFFSVCALGGLYVSLNDTLKVVSLSTPVSWDATSIQGSSISTDAAITGDVLAWDGAQWIHSGITHPAAAGNSADFSSVGTSGANSTGSYDSTGVGDSFSFSAGNNVRIVIDGKTVGVSSAPTGNAVTLQGSALSNLTATNGQVLAWSSAGNSWAPSSIALAFGFSAIGKGGNQLAVPADATILATKPGDNYTISALGNIYVAYDNLFRRIVLSGAPAQASALHGSAISTANATLSQVLAWDGSQWAPSSVTHPTPPPSGTYAAASSISLSAINTTPVAAVGDVFAWGAAGWQASTITHPAGSTPTADYSAVFLAGTLGGGTLVGASGTGAGFTLSAGPNIQIVGSDTTKVIGLSSAPTGNAVTLQGSAISTDPAITGDVLAWDGGQWIHSGITHPTPPPSGTFAAASSISLSAINTEEIAVIGDVFAWGSAGWQASTLTHPTSPPSGTFAAASSINLSAINTTPIAVQGDVFAWGPTGWQASTLTHPTPPPSGTFAAASSISLSAINTTPVAVVGDVFAWGPTGWQASTLTHPAAAGTNATTLQGSDINTKVATNGQVLAWSSTANAWVASSIVGGGGVGGGISSIVEDTTPQLGGDLDTNGFNISSFAGSNLRVLGSHLSATNLSAIDTSSIRIRATGLSSIDVSSTRLRAINASAPDVSSNDLYINTVRPNAAGGTEIVFRSDSAAQNRIVLTKQDGVHAGLLLATTDTLSLSAPVTIRCLTNFTVTGTDLSIKGYSGALRYIRVGNTAFADEDMETGTPIPMHWIQIKNTSATPFTNTSAIFGSIPNTTVYASNDSYSSTYDMNNLGTTGVNITVKRAGYYKVEAFGSLAITATTAHTLTILANETSAVQENRTGGTANTDPNPYAVSTFLYFDIDDAISFQKKSSTNSSFDRNCSFMLTYYGPIIT